jgi:hypothetical protein
MNYLYPVVCGFGVASSAGCVLADAQFAAKAAPTVNLLKSNIVGAALAANFRYGLYVRVYPGSMPDAGTMHLNSVYKEK